MVKNNIHPLTPNPTEINNEKEAFNEIATMSNRTSVAGNPLVDLASKALNEPF